MPDDNRQTYSLERGFSSRFTHKKCGAPNSGNTALILDCTNIFTAMPINNTWQAQPQEQPPAEHPKCATSGRRP